MAIPDTLKLAIANAIRNHAPIPEIDLVLDLDEAYSVQHEITSLCSSEGSGGIKAGVTAKAAQGFFGLDHALIASVYADSLHNHESSLSYVSGRKLECELAVIVDAHGTPKGIAPAIEIVLVQFSRSEDMSASNLVVTNLGADKYIVGEFLDWAPSYKNATAKLFLNGESVNTASMSDAIGGPESSVPWIWQEAKARRFETSGDTLILTGACGMVVSGERGHYYADFGSLGHLEFEID
jgi:2-keto-4-pentenoate hydratase